MAVAKRQSQERSHKNRTREGPGPKNLCWNKQPPWLAQFTQGRLRGREAGNGNPLQYSCLENPADWGAWWAAVRRVAESWVWLQQLSMHACVGEGNSNPLQCSCLENPKDRGAWWAAVYGVAESRTRLKWLSSSRRKKKTCKQRSQNGAWGLSSLHVFWVGPPSSLQDVFSFACQIKLSCSTLPSVASNFCCGETEARKLQTPLTNMVPFLRFNLGETTSAWPLRKAEAKHSRSPTRQKLPQWKSKTKKTQRSGSDKKPSTLNPGQQKQTHQKTHAAQSQIPEDLWLG